MYRYYSVERPVAPGTFPKKQGCEISNYPERFFVNSAGTYAWGHIDYLEPLTDDEVKAYELKPERYEFSVTFQLTNEQIGRIHKLIPGWKEYVDEDGKKPFADYTLEKVFQTIMQIGSTHTINDHIRSEEYRQYKE